MQRLKAAIQRAFSFFDFRASYEIGKKTRQNGAHETIVKELWTNGEHQYPHLKDLVSG